MKRLIIFFVMLNLCLFLMSQCKREAHSEPPENLESYSVALFAGGCFWCMQQPFDVLDGVIHTVVGYAGGAEQNPTYDQVSNGQTGHAEAVQVFYDPSKISYSKLLETFWMQIDPTQLNGQFADIGKQYRTAIFYQNDQEKDLAHQSQQALIELELFNKPIVTEITKAGPFYKAEENHQKYYLKNPKHYKSYRKGSGREGFLERVWGKEEN